MSKRTIPRLAIATLALGGACDDDNQGDVSLKAGGQNVSKDRIDDIAAAICKHYNECEPDNFRGAYTSVSECQQLYTADLGDTIDSALSLACSDAVLDYYGCLAQLSCKAFASQGEEKGPCSELYVKVSDLCDFEDDEADY